MTGGRSLVLKTPNIEYSVYLRNKYTLLLGDSATGKTAFRDFLLEAVNSSSVMEDVYELQSDFSSIIVVSSESCLIEAIRSIDSLCIVDEKYMSFLEKYLIDIKEGNNYFLFITRSNCFDLDCCKLEFVTEELNRGKYYTYTKEKG